MQRQAVFKVSCKDSPTYLSNKQLNLEQELKKGKIHVLE